MADLASREAAGEMVTKKRKERSDKGAIKGLRRKPGMNDGLAEEGDGQSDDAVAGPSKRKKVATKSKATAKGKEKQRSTKSRKSQLPSSKEFIDDTDEDDQML